MSKRGLRDVGNVTKAQIIEWLRHDDEREQTEVRQSKYNGLNRETLNELCTHRSLSISGSLADCVERLVAYDNNDQQMLNPTVSYQERPYLYLAAKCRERGIAHTRHDTKQDLIAKLESYNMITQAN